MKHPYRICFSCYIATPTSSVNGGWYTIELIDLMSMVDQDQRLTSKSRHEYITYGLHGSAVLFVGIMYFPKYIDDNQLRLRCLESAVQKLLTFERKNVKFGRIVFRVEEKEIIWERHPAARQVSYTLSPDSLAGVELEVKNIALQSLTP